MTFELTDHKINPANDQLTITVVDEPGAGGANHHYEITSPNMETHILNFQNGPIGEVGVNGITHEALIAILLHRLQAFQAGPYACAENHYALIHLESVQTWLHERTLSRMSRGVEGTHQL